MCVYQRSTLGISLDALNLRLYTAIARVILFIVSGNSVPKRTGEQAAPRCDRTSLIIYTPTQVKWYSEIKVAGCLTV